MSKYAHAYALRERPFKAAPAKPRRKRSFTIPLIELLRPDGYWPQPLSVEQAFELMRWMVDTGTTEYETALRWGCAGVAELLNGASTLGAHHLRPICSLDDLRKRFHYAVLARPESEGQQRWREDHDVKVTATITVCTPTYRPFDGADHLGWRSEGDIINSLEALMTGSSGKRMAVALNSVHQETVNWLHNVTIGITRDYGFSFLLTYGVDPSEWGASRWTETIAHSRKGESFLDTLARAVAVFKCLVNGDKNGADTDDLLTGLYKKAYVKDQINALQCGGAQ